MADLRALTRIQIQAVNEIKGEIQINSQRLAIIKRRSIDRDDVAETNGESHVNTRKAERTLANAKQGNAALAETFDEPEMNTRRAEPTSADGGRDNATFAPAGPLDVHRPDEQPIFVQDSDAIMDADVEVKVEEDIEVDCETDELNGLDGQQEHVRCLTVNRPDDHDSLTTWSQALICNAETPAPQFHLLVEDTRWRITPARSYGNAHFLSLSFGRALLSGALATASPTDMLKESTSAMPDELRDRSTRSTHRAQGYQSDLSNTNIVIDGSTS